MPPGHRECVPLLGMQTKAAGASGLERVVVDLAAVDDWRPLVEQSGEGTCQPGLALTSFAEQDEVMTCDQGSLNLGNHGLVESDDPRKCGGPGAKHVEEVLSYLFFDRKELDAAGA